MMIIAIVTMTIIMIMKTKVQAFFTRIWAMRCKRAQPRTTDEVTVQYDSSVQYTSTS